MADARPGVTEATSGPAATILALLGRGATDTIVITDVAGRVTWISANVEAMSGYTPAELVGWPVAELYPGGPEEARRIMRRLRAGAPLRDYLTTFPARGGRAIAVRCAMALLRDDRGIVTGTVGVLRILT
jgi:PAS domain S-box-containing protein